MTKNSIKTTSNILLPHPVQGIINRTGPGVLCDTSIRPHAVQVWYALLARHKTHTWVPPHHPVEHHRQINSVDDHNGVEYAGTPVGVARGIDLLQEADALVTHFGHEPAPHHDHFRRA